MTVAADGLIWPTGDTVEIVDFSVVDPTYGIVYCSSEDGAKAYGTQQPGLVNVRGTRWVGTAATLMYDFAFTVDYSTQPVRATPDGSVIVGTASSIDVYPSNRAVLWESSGATGTILEPLAGYDSSFVQHWLDSWQTQRMMSDDGSKVVGWSLHTDSPITRAATLWTSGVATELAGGPGSNYNQAICCSSDGDDIFGHIGQLGFGLDYDAHWWDSGTPKRLSKNFPLNHTRVSMCIGSGAIVYGTQGEGGGFDGGACYWDDLGSVDGDGDSGTFHMLDKLPESDAFSNVQVVYCADELDGDSNPVCVGTCDDTDGNTWACRWRGTTIEKLSTTGARSLTQATGCSADGSIVSGYYYEDTDDEFGRPCWWDVDGDIHYLDTPKPEPIGGSWVVALVYGVSGDGTFFYGYGTPEAEVITFTAGTQFFIAEIDAFQPATADELVYPIGFNEVPWNTLSLVPFAVATTTTIRASDIGYRTRASDSGSPAGVRAYPPLIAEAFQIDRQVPVAPGDTSAPDAWGTLTLTNDDGRYDGLFQSFSVSGRYVRIWRGAKTFDDSRGIWVDPPYSELAPVFTGFAESWFLGPDTLVIRLRDASFWLERLYQRNQYGGTGDYDGSEVMTGSSIPRTRGSVFNITPVRISDTRIVYKVSDAAATIAHVYEGAFEAFTYDGDVGNLFDSPPPASPAPGHWHQDSANGAFELGSEPVHVITCDVNVGEFPVFGPGTNWADIALHIMTEDMGLDEAYIDTASFAQAAIDYPGNAGGYFGPDDRVDGAGAVTRFMQAVGAKLIPDREGKLRCFVLRAIPLGTPPVLTITELNCASLTPVKLPDVLSPPPYRIRLACRHNYTIQSGDFDGAATAAAKLAAGVSDTYGVYTNADMIAAYARPNDLPPFGGALDNITPATEFAAQIGELWSAKRSLYDAVLPVGIGIPYDIGDVVRVIYPMGDLRNGRLGQIVGERFRSNEPTITLRILV